MLDIGLELSWNWNFSTRHLRLTYAGPMSTCRGRFDSYLMVHILLYDVSHIIVTLTSSDVPNAQSSLCRNGAKLSSADDSAGSPSCFEGAVSSSTASPT